MPATLITGANRELGLEFSRQYLADEWQVFAAFRDPKTALELLALPDPAQKLRVLMDVTDSDSVRAAAEEIRGNALMFSLTMQASVEGGIKQSGTWTTPSGRK
jgi:NAD(P)-dependent dehydrogenase (short-subunit alcohol dehydrogenase family)